MCIVVVGLPKMRNSARSRVHFVTGAHMTLCRHWAPSARPTLPRRDYTGTARLSELCRRLYPGSPGEPRLLDGGRLVFLDKILRRNRSTTVLLVLLLVDKSPTFIRRLQLARQVVSQSHYDPDYTQSNNQSNKQTNKQINMVGYSRWPPIEVGGSAPHQRWPGSACAAP